MSRTLIVVPVFVLLLVVLTVPVFAIRSVVLQFPTPGLRVDAYFFSRFCPQGTPCDIETYYADSLGHVSVPLLYGGPDVYYWWGKIHLDFPAYLKGAAYLDRALAPSVELFPDTNPADRWTNYTVPCDTVDVHNLKLFRTVHDWYQTTYGYSREAMKIKYSDRVEYYSYGDEIEWTADPALWSHYSPGWEQFTAAHEYAHAVDQAISGHPPYCTTSTGGILGFVGATDCVTHTICDKGQSFEGSWSEGFADANGWLFANSQGFSYSPRPCWMLNASWTSGFYQGNCATLWFRMASFDPRGTFDCYRYARMVNAQGQQRAAITAEEFYALGRDVDPDATHWISVHHPGTWNAEPLYRWVIQGQTLTGVAEDSTFTEHEKLHWIRRISPNPATGSFSVRAWVPTSRDVQLTLFSLQGQRLCSERYTGLPLGEVELAFHAESVASGVYYILYEDVAHRARDSSKVAIVR